MASAVVIIAIVAALIAAAILLATNAGQDSDLGQFIGDNVDESVKKISDFIQQNSGSG